MRKARQKRALVGKPWTRFYVTEWREYRGLQQKELAKLAGISESLISQIEARNVNGSPESLEKIAGALGVSLGVLFDVKPHPGGRLVEYWIPEDRFQLIHNMLSSAGAVLITVTE
jgi:transcriptional regulator with XRE-family HTH domain